jgi:peptidoglycan/xylan/chitin deacetylase (PgdA/CDA1 family)
VALGGRWAVLSLDLEEDHAGLTRDLEYQALEALPLLVQKLAEQNVPLTVFVAGNFLEKKGSVLRGISSVEFYSHGYCHPPLAEARQHDVRQRFLKKGLEVFEDFFQKPPLGYRAPYGIIDVSDLELLARSGVRFDSSFFPGPHVSGFHLGRGAKPLFYPELDLMEFPVAPHPLFRLPFGLSYAKLLGGRLFYGAGRLGPPPNPLIFDFHLHDLVPTAAAQSLSVPWKWIYASSRASYWELLDGFLNFARGRGYVFISMGELLKKSAAAWKASRS